MPFSNDHFNSYVSDLVGMLRPARVLDIGPGAGKYGNLVRSRASVDQFETHLSAIEIDQEYIDKYELRMLYNEVGVGHAGALINNPRLRYDLVIMGDVIEHMRKSVAVDLLNFLVYRTGYICVIYPHEMCQDDWEGHLHEAHISTWGQTDFQGWNVHHREWENMRLALIKGYLPTRMIVTG